MRIMHFCFSRKYVSYSLLTMLTIALLFACKKSEDVAKPPVIAYAQKIIVCSEDAPLLPVRPDSTGGAITEYSISPVLPKGIVIDKLSGVISGTPSDTLTPTQFVVKAMGPGGFDTDTLTLAIGTVGFNYGTTPTYTFELNSTALNTTPLSPTIIAGTFSRYFVSPYPDSLSYYGLTFNPQTGQISGSPAKLTSSTEVPRPYTVTITGISSANKAASATISFILNDWKPNFTYTFKGSFTAGTDIGPNLQPTLLTPSGLGLIKKYIIAPGSPALPAGLTLDATTGKIGGNPTAAANVTVVVRGMNTGGYTDVNVPLKIDATAIAPQINYMLAWTSGSLIDTVCARIVSGGTIYLTRNDSTNLTGTGAAIPAMYLNPLLLAGQPSNYSVSPAYSSTTDGLSFATATGIISGAAKTGTATIADRAVTVNNAAPGGPVGTFNVKIVANSPYFTYSSGMKRSELSNSFAFLQNQPVSVATATPNGYPGYTTTQLAAVGSLGGGTYAIYPTTSTTPTLASLGLTFNTATGAISGTPTSNTMSNTNYPSYYYLVVGTKADGSFTFYKIRIRVFRNETDWMNLQVYP
ncbi:putative Ig domain-containing protein [Chitinophagaceae bacterium LB-8]|uniref:Ig domain-containing protein n=1 Tax=Paraflavisolibacter caeni TaxID=2982496 RepID=A0A9X2XMT1_9BACT|nr:putative Ig domain-containing protein [Paraflavisolibacter caeni]MCU7547888.1 putative Ig domain-containing protein [Paraflavisolibacter caeni]